MLTCSHAPTRYLNHESPESPNNKLVCVCVCVQVAASNGYQCVFTTAYILWSGLAPRVFGGEWSRVMSVGEGGRVRVRGWV